MRREAAMDDPPLTLHPDERIWLNEYRHAINERHPGAVVRMVVYGSKARGDAHEDSDIDVLLIVKNEAAELKRRLRRIGYRLSATSYAVPSILAYTQDEWASYKNLGSAFHEAVERDAVAVL
jgi:predicted nucleotidyltransferase